MPEVEIRPVVAVDIPELAKIEHDNQSEYVWQMERTFGDNQITIGFREIRLPRAIHIEYPHTPDWQGSKIGGQSTFLTAVLAGSPVGYISLDDTLVPNTAWVQDLAIGAHYRHQGIGIALLLAGQEWAIRRGLKRMVMEMHSKNYPAIRLALKLGFEFCGYNDQYYANQDIALFFSRLLR
jgi:ribosomal protein S18 acetylase RimI-like enzyme